MSKFLSFLGWFFGIIFLLGAIPYFWCGEFFLGLWSLVVVVVLIPPLYKYASGKLDSKFSKPKTLIFSLVVFALLFANFVRPVIFHKDTVKEEWFLKARKRQEDNSTICEKAIKKYSIKQGESKKIKCYKQVRIYRSCFLMANNAEKIHQDIKRSKETPNIVKLGFLIFDKLMPSDLKNKDEITRKNIKAECGYN